MFWAAEELCVGSTVAKIRNSGFENMVVSRLTSVTVPRPYAQLPFPTTRGPERYHTPDIFCVGCMTFEHGDNIPDLDYLIPR